MSEMQRIADYIEAELLPEGDERPVTPDEDLLLRDIDSMGVVNLVAFLEQSFGISIRPAEVTVKHFRTVETMVKLIQSKRGGD